MTNTAPHTGSENVHESLGMDPARKTRLAQLFMHNPAFAETFFKARMGDEGMVRFRALQRYIHESMTDLELGVILDSPHIGTLALLSRFFDPEIPSVAPDSVKANEVGEGKEERVKMNQWCWIFLGAWTVGEAGRTLRARQNHQAHGESEHKVEAGEGEINTKKTKVD